MAHLLQHGHEFKILVRAVSCKSRYSYVVGITAVSETILYCILMLFYMFSLKLHSGRLFYLQPC